MANHSETIFGFATIMKTFILVAALLALAASAPKPGKLNFRNLYVEPTKGLTKPSPRIIGGQEAQPHQFPHQGFIEAESLLEGWYCGASVISVNYILTAGHCLQDEYSLPATQAKVTLGAHRVLEPEDDQVTQTITDAASLIQHPEYDSVRYANDIAVIKLNSAVELNDAIKTIPLPKDDSSDYAGASATISGWGLTEGHGTTLSPALNYLETEVITNEECHTQFLQFVDDDYSTEGNICTTGANNSGTCSGDSGGPLTVDGVQVGVVSFGIRYCPNGSPSAYTRVTKFLDFISANTDVKA